MTHDYQAAVSSRWHVYWLAGMAAHRKESQSTFIRTSNAFMQFSFILFPLSIGRCKFCCCLFIHISHRWKVFAFAILFLIVLFGDDECQHFLWYGTKRHEKVGRMCWFQQIGNVAWLEVVLQLQPLPLCAIQHYIYILHEWMTDHDWRASVHVVDNIAVVLTHCSTFIHAYIYAG